MKHLILFAAAMLAACAQSYQPIVDTKGQDLSKYQVDLAECRQYAEQVNVGGEAVGTAIAGAAIGAALGAALGAVTGRAGLGASYGAAYGGTSGMAAGGINAATSQIGIIRRCLAGRGYNVLR